LFGSTTQSALFNLDIRAPSGFSGALNILAEVVMTEKDLSKYGLLEEFSIEELEQRLEFEAWLDGNCGCAPTNICPIYPDTDCGCGFE
jgi:hypothetical protein